MKTMLLLLLSFGLAIMALSCRTSTSKKPTVKPAIVTNTKPVDTAKSAVDAGPDTAFLRKRLFAFFEAHKKQNFFDTTDDTYVEYWGPINYPPYTVKAGHLFNKNQFHAMIFYANEGESRMIIYLKKDGKWTQIYQDSNVAIVNALPEFKDWNGDGEKDIQMVIHNSWSDNYQLWLVDKTGQKVYWVEKFEDIPEPKPEKGGIVSSEFFHAMNVSFAKYRFDNYKLTELSQVNAGPLENGKYLVRWFKNDSEIKEVTVPRNEVWKHLPAEWKKKAYKYF